MCSVTFVKSMPAKSKKTTTIARATTPATLAWKRAMRPIFVAKKAWKFSFAMLSEKSRVNTTTEIRILPLFQAKT